MSRRPGRRSRVVPFAGSSFSPTDIPGLVLWLDNSLITESGGLVTAWPDLSGAGHHFAQANPSLQPNYIASETDFPTAQAAVKFDVAQSHMTCAPFAIRWVAAVGVYPATTFSGNPALFQGQTTTTERVLRGGNNGTNVWLQTNTWCDTASFWRDGVSTATALTTANAPHLWICQMTAANTPATSWSLGGVLTAATWLDSIAMVVAGDQELDASTLSNLVTYCQGRGMIP